MSHFKILGFGNAIVDLLAKTTIDTIHQHQIQHGGMTLIDTKNAHSLLKQINLETQAPGGSTANTLRYLASKGHKTAFIGGMGNDKNGEFLKNTIANSNIATPQNCYIDNQISHFCIVCITPESERSMATYINEKLSITPNMIPDEWILNSEYIYVEAYLWTHAISRESVKAMALKARKANKKIIFSLADSNCIKGNFEEIKYFCLNFSDYVFANHEEICALMETTHIDEAKYECKKNNQITWIITEGKHGACVIQGMEYIHLPAVSVPKVIDKTGAGDFFAGGFINGLLRDKNLLDCGISASKAAARIIQQIGTGLPFKNTNPSHLGS